jgi:acyl carrier protein phosphodiesterase
MNWLAHVFLSEPDTEFRLGNLLADLVGAGDLPAMGPRFQRGVQCHRAIDHFTDFHPLVQRSQSRLGREFRIFTGILVDIFYDHCLARNWGHFAPVPLERFAAEFYAAVRARPLALPEEARAAVEGVIAEDRLVSYRELAGVEAALRHVSERLSARTGRAFALERAVGELEAHYEGIEQDFFEFFPELRRHVEPWLGA